jgi:hypothetical protein
VSNNSLNRRQAGSYKKPMPIGKWYNGLGWGGYSGRHTDVVYLHDHIAILPVFQNGHQNR